MQHFRLYIRFVISLFLFLLNPYPGFASDVESPNVAIEETDQTEPGSVVLQPKKIESGLYEGRGSESNLAWAIYLFLFMVAVVLGLWLYNRKGGLAMNRLGSNQELKIRETKPLGNRQFLVVVEYGEQKMLLGVAPGMINHLCYLEGTDMPTNEEIVVTHQD